VAGAQPAMACGGLVGPGGTVQLARTTTLAGWHDGVEHYLTSFTYAGGGARFGSIVPLPGVPTEVAKGGEWTLQRLVRETQPQPVFLRAGAVAEVAAPAEELLTTRVDALDLTVLRGGGRAVGDWARAHGFGLSPDAPEVLDFYADRSPIFLAASFDARRAAAQINRKIDQALELRDLRVQAKDALDDKIRRLEGEAGVLRVTLQQRQQRQAGQVRGGGKCDLSGTSDAEYWIIMHESGGDPTADNPRSTAFGLGQLLIDGRRHYLGANADTTDCALQLQAFRGYVRDRYGTAENARAFWVSHGWY